MGQKRDTVDEAGRTKQASGLVYLVNELGAARVAFEALKKYVREAVDLVEQSDKKDHLYEVAGHVIKGLPESLFELDRSLKAVGMAASYLDYEDLKEQLPPGKSDELDRLLEEQRVKKPTRRESMNTKEALVAIERLAESISATGEARVGHVHEVIASIEGHEVHTPARLAASLRTIAANLRTEMASGVNPSRVMLAQALRLALSRVGGAGDEFKKENPELSEADVEKINDMHEKHKDVVKDKHAGFFEVNEDEAAMPGMGLAGSAALDDMVMSARKAAMAAKAGNEKRAFFYLLGVLNSVGTFGRMHEVEDTGYLTRVWRAFARKSGARPSTNFA